MAGSNSLQQDLAYTTEPYDIYDYLRIKDRVSPRDLNYDNELKRNLQLEERARRVPKHKPQVSTDLFDDRVR